MNLGLDLKGGVHLVLRVQTDDALRLETETTVERLRDTLTRGSIQFTKLEMTDGKTFVDRGRHRTIQAYRTAAVDADTVYNRSSGVGGYTYSMKPNIENQLRGEAVTQALQTIERRVNELGVAEPIVARQGAVDQILVELPGVSDVQRAKDLIRSTALLELKIVEQGPFASEEQARQAYNNDVPPDMLVLPGSGDPAAGGAHPAPCTTSCAARRWSPAATSATPGRRSTRTTCRRSASRSTRTARASSAPPPRQNIGRQLAIVLDGRVIVGARDPEPHLGRRAHQRRVHAAGGAGPVAGAAVGRAAGVARPTSKSAPWARRSAPTRSAPAWRRRSAASRSWSSSWCSTTSSPASTRSSRSS